MTFGLSLVIAEYPVMVSVTFYLELVTFRYISKILELVPFQFQDLKNGTSSISFLYKNWNFGLKKVVPFRSTNFQMELVPFCFSQKWN